MDRAKGRTERVLKILQWLTSSGPLTVSDIYKRLNGKVSRRNIQRDLVTLEQVEFPLLKHRLEDRSYSWMLDPARTGMIPSLLGVDEYIAALLLREGLPIFQGTVIQDEIDALIRKLGQIAPEEYFDEDNLSVLESLPFGEVDYKEFSDVIQNAIEAIRAKRLCVVIYRSRAGGQPKHHRILPLRLIHHRAGLYIAAYSTDKEITFFLAIDRIEGFELTNKVMRNVPRFSLSDIKYRRFGLMPDDRFEFIKLEFDSYTAPLIKHRLWHQSQHIEEKKDGRLILSMRVELSPDLESWIMRWMPHVTIKSPKTLRHGVRKKMEEGLDINSG